jgi:hypothetical protein
MMMAVFLQTLKVTILTVNSLQRKIFDMYIVDFNTQVGFVGQRHFKS